jgi:hypothetical protein
MIHMTRKRAEKYAKAIVATVRAKNENGTADWTSCMVKLHEIAEKISSRTTEYDVRFALDEAPHFIVGCLPIGWRLMKGEAIDEIVVRRA